MKRPTVKFLKTNVNARLPEYKTPYAAGMDLYSVEEVTLISDQPVAVDVGFKMQLPPGYEAQIRPRSGLALNEGITVLNAPGTIDEDYRGPVKVILMFCKEHTIAPTIKVGDRIAQLVIAPYIQAHCKEVQTLNETERGEGGFGSTGK